MAYTQTLQCWAKRANLPMPGQAHLLVESILELCKTMEQYVSFLDNIIFGGVALPEGFFRSQTSTPPTSTDVPSEEVAIPVGEPLEESTLPQLPQEKQVRVEAPLNQFPGWEKVLHSSWPVTAAGQVPPAFGEMKQRCHHWNSEMRRAQCQRVEEWLQVELAKWDSPSPKSLESTQMVTLPPGFEEVTACL